MSDFENFRLSKKAQILIYSITAVAAFAALVVLFSTTTTEQHIVFAQFMAGILALLIGLMLYLFGRKFPAKKKFIDSMTILILFMVPVGLSFPLLIEYHVGIYYFFPIYLVGLIGWLFFAKHVIYSKNTWHDEPFKKQTLIPWYILIGFFFALMILLVVLAPSMPNWAPT